MYTIFRSVLSRSSLMASVVAPVVAVLAGAGCGEEVFVQVNCETVNDPAVVCKAQQTKGKTEVEVCWDFTATCGNGTKVKAERACVKVKDGGTVTHRTEKDKLSNLDKCAGDAPPTAVVENMTINGKASTLPAPAQQAPAPAPTPAK